MGQSGGLVEIDDQGKVVRSASTADPAFPDALLTPYSLVVLPDIDRVVSTNSSMHDEYIFSGVTYQVWRLSDLKLLKTEYLDVGENHYGQISPEEPRLGADGSIFVQTLGCGIERITGIATDAAEIETRLDVSRTRSAACRPSSDIFCAKRAGDARPDRHGHCQWREAGGSFAAEAERQLFSALDGMGR